MLENVNVLFLDPLTYSIQSAGKIRKSFHRVRQSIKLGKVLKMNKCRSQTGSLTTKYMVHVILLAI